MDLACRHHRGSAGQQSQDAAARQPTAAIVRFAGCRIPLENAHDKNPFLENKVKTEMRVSRRLSAISTGNRAWRPDRPNTTCERKTEPTFPLSYDFSDCTSGSGQKETRVAGAAWINPSKPYAPLQQFSCGKASPWRKWSINCQLGRFLGAFGDEKRGRESHFEVPLPPLANLQASLSEN